jgi:soluble lytic murein transglycosylase-like protein
MRNAEILTLYRAIGRDWQLYAAQGWVESRWESDRVSPAGAHGIAQFMLATWRWMADEGIITRAMRIDNPADCIAAQVLYMRWLARQWSEIPALRGQLAAYNHGIGNLTALKHRFGREWEKHLPLETYAYIRQVLTLRDWIVAEEE